MKNKLNSEETDAILNVLKERFEGHRQRFEKVEWPHIESKLRQDPQKIWSLHEMEETGGEPDLLAFDEELDQYIFCDFSKESPKDRRSLCYDNAALESRKQNKPAGSAKDMASRMGVELMDERDYKLLQTMGKFDTKTSSWLETPPEIRNLGGAIFGDRRYDHVFIYHNGAESYYAARGFRGILKL